MSVPSQTQQSQGTSSALPIPSPYLGLNTRDGYTLLRPEEARVLENWLPDTGSCRVRQGYTSHQDITAATSVPSLMVWRGATGTQLIAGANAEIYDVTGTPSVKTAAAYTSSVWYSTNFNGFLFGVNGADTPWRYNGSVTSATGFTGPTLTTLQTISQVRNRLWFTQTNSADVRYGAVGAVTGALTTFQLSQIAGGGKCVAIGSWSRDAGDGADDFTVFVMSTGEVIVYQGDPDTTFALQGKYMAPVPVGLDTIVKVGGELLILTSSGPIPVTAIIAGNAFDPVALKEWGKIAPSWQKDYQLYGDNIRWSAVFFNGIVYFNIPTGATNSKQYIYNTRVAGWAVYTNIPSTYFASFLGSLYFGALGDGVIFRHATGLDNGSQIVTTARQGFTLTGNNLNARYVAMRPNINADGFAQGQFQLDTDFREGSINATVYDLVGSVSGAEWDTASWDTSSWAGTPDSQRKWRTTRGYGRAVAPVVKTYSAADEVIWFSTDLMAEAGGVL